MAKPSRKTQNPAAEASPSQYASVWSPMRHSVFRALWIASVVSNIGSWMQDVGESWLMTSLTLSPLLVALVETAGSLPVVLAALPAGALADIVDRRRLLIVMQVWMVIVATAMGLMALTGHMTTGRLLSLTFFLGIGSAVSNPVWQAITPELVPSEDLPAALSLGGVAINIARAIGPAIGGFIIAASGPWVVLPKKSSAPCVPARATCVTHRNYKRCCSGALLSLFAPAPYGRCYLSKPAAAWD